MTTNNARDLSVATALFFTWSVLTFAVRVWVKLGRSEGWGWDDSTTTAALAFSLFHIIAILRAVHDGYGLTDDTLATSAVEAIHRAFYASEFFYIVSIGFSKVATGLFIGQLTRHGPQVKRAYAAAALCGVWIVASVLVVGLRAPLGQPWDTVDGTRALFIRWLIVEATGLAVELMLWGLSINVIWTLSMPLSKRCTILAIFGCRLLLIPLVSLRLFWLSPAKNPDNVLTSMTANILTEAVLQFAFISASVTCLKPFLKPFSNSTYVVSSGGNSGSHWRAGAVPSAKDPYYVLSTVQGSDKNGVVVSETEPRPAKKNGPPGRKSFRPDNFEQEATISASSRKSSSEDGQGSDNMIIRKTDTWSVRVEEGDARPAGAKKSAQVATVVEE